MNRNRTNVSEADRRLTGLRLMGLSIRGGAIYNCKKPETARKAYFYSGMRQRLVLFLAWEIC